MEIINKEGKYLYRGNMFDGLFHGHGNITYTGGDFYEGGFKYGRYDGYGVFTATDGNTHSGFYLAGKPNGLGLKREHQKLYRGDFRNGVKCGKFIMTDLTQNRSYVQLWRNGVLIKSTQIQYVAPDYMQVKKNKKIKKKIEFKGVVKTCGICYIRPINSAIANCGHTNFCNECIEICNNCPTCRGPIDKIIKLYIS